jgi:hypothetical protein
MFSLDKNKVKIMIDVKLIKVFKRENDGEDIYVLSIKLDDNRYYNLNVTKSEFEKIHHRIESIYDNDEY